MIYLGDFVEFFATENPTVWLIHRLAVWNNKGLRTTVHPKLMD